MSRRRHVRSARSPALLLISLLALLLASCATPPLPEESQPVVGLMAERLELARDIAWAKWTDGLPVRDPVREVTVLEKLIRQGEAAGIEEPLVSHFVRAQIEASCLEQEAWMARWRKGTPLPTGEPPTLDNLRQQVDRLSSFLIAEWAAAITTPRAPARQRLLKSAINPRAATVAVSGFPDADL
ncbi:MAG: gamma subclass chorismate mutase AroQ [Terrimicrobiaceae bacterium]